MSDHGIIELEGVILIMCFTVAASPLTADHIIQAWLDLLVEIFAKRLTTILRLFIYMESALSIARMERNVKNRCLRTTCIWKRS